MSERIFEAKSVEQAVRLAAEEFGVAEGEVGYEVVGEKSDDFWGLGDTLYRVRVWVQGEQAAAGGDETAAAPPPAKEDGRQTQERAGGEREEESAVTGPVESGQRESAAQEAGDSAAGTAAAVADVGAAPASEGGAAPGAAGGLADVGREAAALLGRFFEAMEFDCAATAQVEGATIHVAIRGEDNQYLLEGRGRGLAALELILNHAFRHRFEGAPPKFRVDAGDFRSRRDEELRDLAYQVAHRAKETGEAQQTRPLNPYERRIVHLTLADDPQVTTRSEGSGFEKAVNVIPRNRPGRR